MGFDPPGLGEVYEVCIELSGPVEIGAFKKFEQELRKCIKDMLSQIDDPQSGAKLHVKKTKAEFKIK
jgi:hypothetical protein